MQHTQQDQVRRLSVIQLFFITFQPITHKPIRIETPSDKKTYAENCDSIKKSEAKIKSNMIQLMKTVYFWTREYQIKKTAHNHSSRH